MVRNIIFHSKDRILVLERVDPKKDTGLVDPAVFEGKNNLHCVQDELCMWYFKYERGVIPPALKSKFTSFAQAKEQAEIYFNQKNIKIVDVKDA